jgi:3-oxosteroid 1-dehydrogenase
VNEVQGILQTVHLCYLAPADSSANIQGDSRVSDIDVVVLGTGAAALTAAIAAHEAGARVAVFEKSDQVGGTTAWSGGQIWIPNNPQMKALGKEDSREDALTYLMSMSHGLIARDMAETFVDTGPAMVNWIESCTPVKFVCVPDFPDYHPEQPGGKPGCSG